MENSEADAVLLAHHRQAHPHVSLTVAKELHRVELKFGHLGRIKLQREQQTQQQKQARQEVTKGPMRAQGRD